MQRQHDDGPQLFDQFDDDQFDDLEPAADPETSEFWDHMPNGRLERLREARFQARTRRRSITQTPSTPTAPEVVQRIRGFGFSSSDAMSPKALAESIQSARETWRRLARDIHMQPE